MKRVAVQNVRENSVDFRMHRIRRTDSTGRTAGTAYLARGNERKAQPVSGSLISESADADLQRFEHGGKGEMA